MPSGIRAPRSRPRWGSISRRRSVWRGEWPNHNRRAHKTAVPNARNAIPGGGGGIGARSPGYGRRLALSRPASPTILGATTAQDASGDPPMGISSIDRATQNLVKWSARGEWEALQREAYAAHFEPVIDSLDLPDDALDVLPDDAAGMLSVFHPRETSSPPGSASRASAMSSTTISSAAAGANRCPPGATWRR